jgi:hypothetical protein
MFQRCVFHVSHAYIHLLETEDILSPTDSIAIISPDYLYDEHALTQTTSRLTIIEDYLSL